MCISTLPGRPTTSERIVMFNVGGKRFETFESTLTERCGNRWMAELIAQCIRINQDEYFVDRNPKMFRCVLDYCRTGHLHIPHNICGPFIREELAFWNISPALIRPCCWGPFTSDDSLRFASEFMVYNSASYKRHFTERKGD